MEDTRIKAEAERPPTVIFALMTLTNILINLDHGILPACTAQLEEDFDMNGAELGFLGSVVYLGIVLMGLFVGRLYQHFNSKWLTLIALIALEVCLLLFVISSHKVTAYISRFLTGSCQVFLLVYYPIWIDKFGSQKKTLWLTLLQVCVPVGIFMGYGMTAVIINMDFNYKISFYIQIGLVALFIIAFFLLSNRKLDSRRKLSQDNIDPLIESILTTRESQTELPNEDGMTLPTEQIAVVEEPVSPTRRTLNAAERKKKYEFFEMAKHLIRSKMYIVGTLTMSVILFVSTGIQFWLTDYFIRVLQFPRSDVNIAYGVVSITGPTSGAAFGGFVINRIGGYDHHKAIYFVFVFASIGIGSAVIIPFMENFYVLCVLLWIVLFFGGAMMPGLTGIMMCSVAPYLRAFGNSNGEIIKNIFGYLPSPFVYGLFNELFDDRAGIKFLMFWGMWAPILLALGSWHNYRSMKRLAAKKEQIKSQRLPQPAPVIIILPKQVAPAPVPKKKKNKVAKKVKKVKKAQKDIADTRQSLQQAEARATYL